jgi:hypothetical protein
MDGLILLRALWDRVAAWAFILGGALLVLDSGLHARDAVYTANSFSFLTSGGLGGLAALGFGCTLLVSAGFHDEWRKLDRIEAALAGRGPTGDGAAPPARWAGLARWLRAEGDRVAGWALVVVAAGWLALGSRLVAGALYAPKQVAYVISGGLGAMVTLVLGLAVLLAADTRDEEHKLDRIEGALRGMDPLVPDGAAAHRRRALVAVGIIGLAAGAAIVVVGWWRAADALKVERALDGLVLAAIGAGLMAVVMAVGAVRRRRRLALRAREVLGRVLLVGGAVRPADRHLNGSSGTNGSGGSKARWTASGLQRFHRAACPALAMIGPEDRTLVRVEANLEPCLLCDAGE